MALTRARGGNYVGKIRKKIRQITTNQLELPKDVVFDLPRITVLGSYLVYIENHKGIVQFTPQYLHIRLSKGELKVIGTDLSIRVILPEEIQVEGKIQDIQYID